VDRGLASGEDEREPTRARLVDPREEIRVADAVIRVRTRVAAVIARAREAHERGAAMGSRGARCEDGAKALHRVEDLARALGLAL
jgi:hypothetical protein